MTREIHQVEALKTKYKELQGETTWYEEMKNIQNIHINTLTNNFQAEVKDLACVSRQYHDECTVALQSVSAQDHDSYILYDQLLTLMKNRHEVLQIQQLFLPQSGNYTGQPPSMAEETIYVPYSVDTRDYSLEEALVLQEDPPNAEPLIIFPRDNAIDVVDFYAIHDDDGEERGSIAQQSSRMITSTMSHDNTPWYRQLRKRRQSNGGNI